MSYDIALYPRQPGQEWDEAIREADTDDHALTADDAALARGVEVFGRIEAQLREVLSGPVETWVAEETGGDVYGELTATETGIQVELFDRSAAVSFSYGDDSDVERVHREVREAVGVVARETGYEAYDPQTDASFDGTFDDEHGATPAADPAGPQLSVGMTPGDQARQPPVNLRRRGWIYLILGIAIVALAAQRFASGNGNAITIVLLVIGGLDLLGGAFLLAISGRKAQDERLRQQP